MKTMSLFVIALASVVLVRVEADGDSQKTSQKTGKYLINKSDIYELKSFQGQTSKLPSKSQLPEQEPAKINTNKHTKQQQKQDSDKIIRHSYYWSSPDGRASSFSQSWASPSGNASGSMMQQHFHYQANSSGDNKDKLSSPNPSLNWRMPSMMPFLWRQQQLFQQQNNNTQPLQ